MAKTGLGKKNSLSSLLSTLPTNAGPQKTGSLSNTDKDRVVFLPIEHLQRGQYQPREHFTQEALEELSLSIKSQGIIQPIVVRSLSDKKYEIIAGERRWRAAQLAGLDRVPVLVKQIEDKSALAMSLIENIQRENLNPIEEARALQRLLDEFSLTHDEVSKSVGKSRTTVTNLIRLLSLSPKVRELLAEGKIELGHAKVLLALQGDEQLQAARMVALRGLTVRETEHLVKQLQSSKTKDSTKTSPKEDIYVRRVREDVSERLGARVDLQHSAKGKGKLVIHYNTVDELQGILDHIK